jgi:ankyrin repeat protein
MLASRDDNQLKLVEILVQYGADINITTEEGISALSMTILCNNRKCTEFYISHHANIFNENLDIRNFSPFMVALSNQ